MSTPVDPETMMVAARSVAPGQFDPEQPITVDNYDKSFGEYDITPYQCPCPLNGTMKYTLALGLDETTRIYKMKDCCGTPIQDQVMARPYAQLGSVDVSMQNTCCCCGAETWMVSTDGGMINPAGTTGTCCNPTDKAMVEEISAQLQERKVLRGNIGLMKMHSANGDKLVGIAKMVDALGAAKQANLRAPCGIEMERTVFPRTSFDVQNHQEIPICMICLKEKYASTLVLEDDELNFITRNPCAQSNSRRPYAQLGVIVETGADIGDGFDPCLCVQVGGYGVQIDGVGYMKPKYGMEKELCRTIAHELQQRKVKLGNIGQLKKGEQIRDVSERGHPALTFFQTPIQN